MTGRPGFHVTAPSGWINDPLGVTWHDGRYELFVQYNPDAPEWAPACRWGQLRSPDLVRWAWVGTALAPGPGEDGCWSGSVVVADGVPVIVYTSVRAGALDLGAVALATGDPAWRTWTPDPAGPVLPGPPPGLRHFRDPFVFRDGGTWRMVVGGGRDDGTAVALQYSGSDLRHWSLDGLLAGRPGTEQPATGSVWECVQLFPLDGAWVLLVSVWDAGEPRRVACAVGDYDGRRFTARAWQRFTATDAVYATTTFADAAGRRCALSWVREPAAPGPAWAGVLSLPVVLSLDGDRVAVAPHPDVDGLRTGVLAEGTPADGDVLGPFEPFLDVVAHLDGPGRLAVGDLLTLDVGPDAVVLRRPGRADERVPMRPPTELRLLVDAELAELFVTGEGAVVRLDPATGPVPVTVSGRGVRHLTVHGMPVSR
ncbi:glycoside hydrolase family 32 protein [Geodermatophilus sp. URMC 64]